TQIEPARLRFGTAGELREHFRTYFIARATNPWATMHYDIGGTHECLPLHELDTALQDPSRGAAPPGVQQRDHPLLGRCQVDGDAVGDRDGEQQSGRAGRVAVAAVEDEPAGGGRAVPGDRRTVDLVREHQPRK